MDRETLIKEFTYDEYTGLFYRNFKRGNKRAGSLAGSINKVHQYVYLYHMGKHYCAHRMAYLYVHGDIPDGFEVDHINGIRSDNRIENLRLATHQLNLQNQKITGRASKSGLIGAYFHKQTGRWSSHITLNKKIVSLGIFCTPEKAHSAYMKAKESIHLFNDPSKTVSDVETYEPNELLQELENTVSNDRKVKVNRVITKELADSIRKDDRPTSQIAKDYGVVFSCIWKIKKGFTWKEKK